MSRYRAFIILLLDVLIIFLCNFLTMLPYLLGQDIRLLNLVLHIGLLTVCVLLFQVCLKTYDTLWRYAESREYLTLLEGMGLGFTLYSVVNLLLGTSRIWISSALTGTALALLVMLGYRFVYRSYRRRVTGVGGGPRAYAAIIGAGSAGAALVSEMDDRIYGRYRPYCVIDDAAEKQQKRIHGVPVLGPIDAMEEILADTPVTDIILAIQNLTPERRQEILNLCARTQRRVHVLGSPVTRLHARQGDYIAAVREVEIEDLLGRAPVQLENPRIGTFLRGKTVSRFRITQVTRSARDFGQIFFNGAPSFGRQGLNSIGGMLLNIAARSYGDAAVAGMSIVSRIFMFILSVAIGVGQGLQPVASFNYGAHKFRRVRQAAIFTMQAAFVLLVVLIAVCWWNDEALIRLFRDDPAVTAVALPAFRYQCLAMLLQPVIVVANMTFQSVGKAGRATFLACCRQGVFFIPLILILPRTHGLFGVEICQPIADVLTFLVSLPFLIAFLQQLGRMDDAEQSKTAS